MSPELKEDVRSTVWGCALVLLVELLFAKIDSVELGPLAMWLDLGHSALAAVSLALLAWTSRTPAKVAALFTIVVVAFLPQTWWSEILGARQGAVRDPLLPHEFLVLGVAMLAPAWRRLGLVLLALLTISGVALWLFLTSRHPIHADGEPWMFLAFAAVGIGVSAYRLSRRRALHQLLKSRAEADALARVARVFRAFRDRANTPLQTLEIGTKLLARRGELSAAGICAMDRAIEQLRALSALLEGTDAMVAESPDSLSSDLEGAIEEATRTMREHPLPG